MTYALHAGDPNPEERHNESLQSFQSLSGFLGEGHPKSQTMNNTSQPGSGRLSPLVATLNLRGRTKMNMIKLLQLDDLLKSHKVAIMFFQESHIQDKTFENCQFIKSNFQLAPHQQLRNWVRHQRPNPQFTEN